MNPIEPHADIRQLAAVYRQMYVAFTEVGFTPAEALALIGQAVAAAVTAGHKEQQ